MIRLILGVNSQLGMIPRVLPWSIGLPQITVSAIVLCSLEIFDLLFLGSLVGQLGVDPWQLPFPSWRVNALDGARHACRVHDRGRECVSVVYLPRPKAGWNGGRKFAPTSEEFSRSPPDGMIASNLHKEMEAKSIREPLLQVSPKTLSV